MRLPGRSRGETLCAGLKRARLNLEPLPFHVWDRFHLAERFVNSVLQVQRIDACCGGDAFAGDTAHVAPATSFTVFLFPFSTLALPPVSTNRFVVGLDAGASNTLLLAECEGCAERIDRQGAAANPQRAGVEHAARTLATLVEDTLRPHRPIDRLSVCAGVAGAGRPEEQEALATHLRRALADDADAVRVEVVHDASIALNAAFGSGSGLVIIAGTGSVVFGRARDGTTRRVGGWGYLLGDEGSGYAVGRAGLQAVAEAFDGGAETSLCARLNEQWGIDGREALIHRVYQDDFSLQAVAPLVIGAAANGDSVAADILRSQVAALMQQVEWLLDAEKRIAPRIALLGGMLHNEHYAQVLRHALRERVPDWSVEILRHEPVVGALRRARHLAE